MKIRIDQCDTVTTSTVTPWKPRKVKSLTDNIPDELRDVVNSAPSKTEFHKFAKNRRAPAAWFEERTNPFAE